MLKEKLKTSNRNFLKMNALYLLLIISNILLFIGLVIHFPQSKIGFISLETFENIASVIAAMIILGYISIEAPKINNLGGSSIVGFVYIPLICVIGVMTAYFTDKFDLTIIDPYLEMFKVLCAVLIFIILATNLKSFKEIIKGKHTRKNQLVCLIVFVLIGLFSSYVFITIDKTSVNIRCLVVMISGLFGGPVVGIPVGIISGAYRYTLGGPTALPCALSTVISGIIGSLIFIWNDKKFPKIIPAIILMFLFTGFEMMMVYMLTPPDISFPFILNIYPIMLFGSVTGMLLFSIVIIEKKEQLGSSLSYEEQKVEDMKNELKSYYDERIEELKMEIEDLLKEKNGNDSQDE